MLKKLLLLVVTGFFLASCAATNTQQGGDVDAASSSTSSGSDSSITAVRSAKTQVGCWLCRRLHSVATSRNEPLLASRGRG
jgi:uncharacterized lipoprotein YajG